MSESASLNDARRIRIVITGEYAPRESDYIDPGDVLPSLAQMARIDAENYASGGASEIDLIDWLEPETVKVTFEAVE